MTKVVISTDDVEEVLQVSPCNSEGVCRLEALRAAVQLGNADIIASRFKTFETKASLRDHFKSLSDKATTFE